MPGASDRQGGGSETALTLCQSGFLRGKTALTLCQGGFGSLLGGPQGPEVHVSDHFCAHEGHFWDLRPFRTS